jgi:ribosomal protein L21E
MSTPADDIIIIKGGSVEIEFNERSFPGQGGKHSNKDKKIVAVEVKDDNTNQTQTVTLPANGRCTIRITTR